MKKSLTLKGGFKAYAESQGLDQTAHALIRLMAFLDH